MSKNSIVAFFLIIGVVFVFTHPLFNKYVWKIEPPAAPAATAQITVEKGKTGSSDAPEIKNKAKENREADLLPTTVVTKADTFGNNPAADTITMDTLLIETDKFICRIAEEGARIVSLKTKEYSYNRTNRVKEINPDSMIELIPEVTTLGGANLEIDNKNYNNSYFKFGGLDKKITVKDKDSAEVSLSFVQNDGSLITKRFSFCANSYRIGLTIESANLDGKSIQLGWDCGLRENEKNMGGQTSSYNKMKVHIFNGKDVEHLEMKKPGQKEESTGQFCWAGITSKYFLVALIPVHLRDADLAIQSFEDPLLKSEKVTDVNYRFQMKRVGEGAQEEYTLYAGPAKIEELKNDKKHLEKVLYGGWRWFLRADLWFSVICEYFLLLLIFLQKATKDWGVAILLITVIIKVLTYPMTLSSMKSMSKMKDLQPKINALRSKYKANPRKMNEEVMALYKAEGVNPLNPGCLPMFLQMPLLIALFIVLQRAIELRGVPTILVPWIKDLSMPEALFTLPFTIPWYGSNVAIVPMVMAVLTFFQNKMTIKDPNQKFMIWFMPLFMFVLFNSFPAGLVIYWTLSSALGLIQQKLVDSSVAKTAPVIVVEEVKKGSKKNKR